MLPGSVLNPTPLYRNPVPKPEISKGGKVYGLRISGFREQRTWRNPSNAKGSALGCWALSPPDEFKGLGVVGVKGLGLRA